MAVLITEGANLQTLIAKSTLPIETGFLGTGGLNVGIEAANDFTTPDDFFYEVPPGKTFLLKALTVYIEDTNASFGSGKYGGIGVLDVGIDFIISINGVEGSVLGGILIKKNTDFSKHGAPLIPLTFGTGNESGSGTIDIERLTGAMRALSGDNATPDRVIVRLSDNFTGLQDHSFKIFGELINN